MNTLDVHMSEDNVKLDGDSWQLSRKEFPSRMYSGEGRMSGEYERLASGSCQLSRELALFSQGTGCIGMMFKYYFRGKLTPYH